MSEKFYVMNFVGDGKMEEALAKLEDKINGGQTPYDVSQKIRENEAIREEMEIWPRRPPTSGT